MSTTESTYLQLAKDLHLPLDASTHTFGILGQRGSGKTSCAAVMVEQMIRAKLPVVVVDPTGGWWGLRSSRDGEHKGLPITILGGEHGDLPLEATGGIVIADYVVETRASVVLDLSLFSMNEQRRFVTDFAERLYHQKATHREPLHLVLDESDEFAPQRIQQEQTRMFGSIDRIVRRGRIRGLGVTMISQRAAVINKDILSQIDTLVVFRTTGPQDRAAIDAWVAQNVTTAQRAELMAQLPTLATGTAWVWGPQWLKVFKCVPIDRRTTFDSSATPKVGAAFVEPQHIAPVDLEQIRARMAETIERAKLTDPRLLRARIDELEAQLAQRDFKPGNVISPDELATFEDTCRRTRSAAYEFFATSGTLLNEITRLGATFDATASRSLEPTTPATKPAREPATPRRPVTPRRPAEPPRGAANDAANGAARLDVLKAGERRMLDMLAHWPHALTRTQLGNLTGFTPSGGTFQSYLSHLRKLELVQEHPGQQLTISPDTHDLLGKPKGLDPQACYAAWRAVLKRGENNMLEALMKIHDGMSREDLGGATGFTASGGTFQSYLSTLRRNDLVIDDASIVRAASWLRAVRPFRI